MIDVAKIKVKAGNGGDGRVSFRREKFIPNGGPDGGDGGNGGSVYFLADHNVATLLDFHAKPIFEATNGQYGGPKNMTGFSGDDLYVKVPVGTLIYELDDKAAEGRRLVGDMTKEAQTLLIARGGIGGKGNTRFKSSKNQAPRQFTPGTKGEVRELVLEIKLMADVGLIGLPNAGKSTLVNQLTKANAKVANYPFTTLTPNLGVMLLKNGKNVVVADIPGLIEGASTGKGLGDEFLRHVERTRLLVHLVDPLESLGSLEQLESPKEVAKALSQSTWEKYQTIRNELGEYSKDLLEKPEIVVINKLDVTEIRLAFDIIAKAFKKQGVEVIGISAYTGMGVEELKDLLMTRLENLPPVKEFVADKPTTVYNIGNLPNRRVVFKNEVQINEFVR
ncbi:MAG: hypothetical protein ACD_22C00102G0002 [uncultured bacterium]|nr:MAG: hypothetical protein ACD_22C00102G0002 [uncultured bacterium]